MRCSFSLPLSLSHSPLLSFIIDETQQKLQNRIIQKLKNYIVPFGWANNFCASNVHSIEMVITETVIISRVFVTQIQTDFLQHLMRKQNARRLTTRNCI